MDNVLRCNKCKMYINEWIIENKDLWIYDTLTGFPGYIPRTIGWKCPNCGERNYYDSIQNSSLC